MASESELQNPLIYVNISDVTKLSSMNYFTWSLQIKALLRRYGLMEFIDESKTPPPEMITIDGTSSPNPKHSSWKAQDCLINIALIDAVETPHKPLIATATTSLEAWTILASTYGGKPGENQSTKPVQEEDMKTVADVVAKRKEVVGMVKSFIESYKEEQERLHLQAQALDEKHQEELRLREETEQVLDIERDRIKTLKLQLKTLEKEHDDMSLQAGVFECKYIDEMILRGKSEIALEELKEVLASQVKTLQEKYEQELSLRKETEDTLTGEREALEVVSEVANAMQKERDNALKIVDEIITKQLEERQQPLQSFICPITHEVMEDPHMAADGFTYEAEAIREWINGHETSPLTNLKLPHLTLVPNRNLRSAIEEFGLIFPASLS